MSWGLWLESPKEWQERKARERKRERERERNYNLHFRIMAAAAEKQTEWLNRMDYAWAFSIIGMTSKEQKATTPWRLSELCVCGKTI